MGWLIMVALALIVGGLLWRFARVETAALQLIGAALLVALAGYAWQGRPGLQGQPKLQAAQGRVLESGFAAMRQDMLGRFDRASAWLNMAESYQRRGDTQSGAEIIRSGLRRDPRSPDLWIGLGYALVLHADGRMTPAAEIAFRRAAEVAPEHPAARFFYGLALAQGGRIDDAEGVWRRLLASLPNNAGQWRQVTEQRLQLIEQLRASRQSAPQPQPQAPQQPQAR